MTSKELQRSESFPVAALLALAGGFLDAYTYLCRGHVFANAQTGNMVLLAVRLAEGEWRRAASTLIPILASAPRTPRAKAIRRLHSRGGAFHWRQTVLLVEMAALTAAACIPLGPGDSAANILVSFVCALQVEAFRKVHGWPFATTMCTGNLRSGTEALWHFAAEGDRKALGRSGGYFAVIACFLTGAALGGAVTARAGQWAVLAAVGAQVAAFLWMCGEKTKTHP